MEYTDGRLSHLIKEKDWQLEGQILPIKFDLSLEVPEDGINEVEATIVLYFTKNKLMFERVTFVYLPH